ncbi:Uncharacterised protein [Mycobacteroides abscessus subsp. abscessus]|nr:Uncharacterised protein [Mycobacteroides abscessus subsp. abscessus]
MRWPSVWSIRHSASTATMVEMTAPTIAASLRSVGLEENRVSIWAVRLRPWGAGPLSWVKTPTICGRRLGSGNPLRRSADFSAPSP